MRAPRWTRLKALFSNQLFASAFFGGAVLLNFPQVSDAFMSEARRLVLERVSFCIWSACLPGQSIIPAAALLFLAAGFTFLVACLCYSMWVPGVISGYPNRGEFIAAARGETAFDEDVKREEWNDSNEESATLRWILTVLIWLFTAAFAGFAIFSARIVFFALLGI